MMSGPAVAILEPWGNMDEAKAKRTDELLAVDFLFYSVYLFGKQNNILKINLSKTSLMNKHLKCLILD